MPLLIRDFTPSDLEAAYRLDQDCFEPGIAYTRAEIRDFLSRRGSVAILAERDGAMAGFAIADAPGATAHLVTIDVAAAERRRGVGRRLLDEMLRRLREGRSRRVRLEVDVGNAAAIRFYERLGFTAGKTLANYYGRGRDGREMVRTL